MANLIESYTGNYTACFIGNKIALTFEVFALTLQRVGETTIILISMSFYVMEWSLNSFDMCIYIR